MIPIKPGQPVEGNKEVCELLEGWLARAKLGQLNFVGLVGSEGPLVVFEDHAGVPESFFAGCFGLDHLKKRLTDILLMGRDRPQSQDAPANMLCYDLEVEPCSFDFLTWLLTAELLRRREGAPAPLRIGFLHENYPVGRFRAFYENVILPVIPMLGAVVDQEAAAKGRRLEQYTYGELVDASRKGDPVPCFVPPLDAKKRMAWRAGCVTITLRECEHWPHRNSNLPEWLLLADHIRSTGDWVVFVRDTAKADAPLPSGYETCNEASLNIQSRMALYEVAKCNLFVPNGPCELAFFSRVPWMIFWHTDPMDPYAPITPNWTRQHMHMEVGQQFPWAGPHQRIVWATDNFEIMRAAWDEFVPVLAETRRRLAG